MKQNATTQDAPALLGVTFIKQPTPATSSTKEMAEKLRDSINSGTLSPSGCIAPSMLLEDDTEERTTFITSGPLGAFAVTVQPLERVVAPSSLKKMKMEAHELAAETHMALKDARKLNRRHRRVLTFFGETGQGERLFWRRAHARKLSHFSIAFAWPIVLKLIKVDIAESEKFRRKPKAPTTPTR